MTATPPRADLRTLAAEAIWADGMGPVMSPDALADAVLAAVLPEYRRLVLAEAAEAIETDAADLGRNGHTGTEEAYLAAVDVIRRLAAAAPETTLSAPVPAETAPAVPEVGMGACDRCTGLFLPGDKIAYDADGQYHAEHFAPAPEASDAGTHGRTAPPRGQTRRLDVAALGFDKDVARAAGWVPLADVFDALMDEAAVERFAERHGDDEDGWYVEHVDRERMRLYLAERFTPTAPEGADERNGHG